MKTGHRAVLALIILAILPGIVALQKKIDPARKLYTPGRGISSVMTEVNNNPVVLPSQFVVGTAIGFREAVAGLLWIKTDELFNGQYYEAILPLLRIITWLDPHQEDVYNMGAWHIAFNLVDANQRADARMLPPAIAFLKEGVKNNNNVWDLKFQLAFMLYYLKGQDLEKSLEWERKAAQDKDPMFYVYRQVPLLLGRLGHREEALAEWNKCMQQGLKLKKEAEERGDIRAAELADMHYQQSKLNRNTMLVNEEFRQNLKDNPLDANFTAKFQRIGPRKWVISGSTNLPDRVKIFMQLADKGYVYNEEMSDFSWEIDPTLTVIRDAGVNSLIVRGGKFRKYYDVSRDEHIYPLQAEDYELVLTIDPRFSEGEPQDYIGWMGEGMTDKNYLDTSIPGLRRIVKVIPLKKKDLT